MLKLLTLIKTGMLFSMWGILLWAGIDGLGAEDNSGLRAAVYASMAAVTFVLAVIPDSRDGEGFLTRAIPLTAILFSFLSAYNWLEHELEADLTAIALVLQVFFLVAVIELLFAFIAILIFGVRRSDDGLDDR